MAMLEAGAGTKPEFQEALRKAYSYLEVSQMVESSPKCVQYYRQYNKVIGSLYHSLQVTRLELGGGGNRNGATKLYNI